jgi:predicted metal-dependent phosphoesterase TrpH
MIIDMHVHTTASQDSPATVEDYCRFAKKFPRHHRLHGITLTEHRIYDGKTDYRKIAEKYGIHIFKGIEVDTDLGHLLLYGITGDFLKHVDISLRRINAKNLVQTAQDCGVVAVPAHPYRDSNFGEAIEGKNEAVNGITVIEAVNGVNSSLENKKASLLTTGNRLKGTGGSDAHYANHHWFLTCATRFDNPVYSDEDLAEELRKGNFRPIRLNKRERGHR